jgi:hypothetical protein
MGPQANYSHPRKRHNFELVNFWKPEANGDLRRVKLIYEQVLSHVSILESFWLLIFRAYNRFAARTADIIGQALLGRIQATGSSS